MNTTTILDNSEPETTPTIPEHSRKQPTPKELEALRYIAAGNDSKTTARLMQISKRTVDFHLANIYLKLDANNRVQAINNARAKGFI